MAEQIKTVGQEEADQATQRRIVLWVWLAVVLALLNLVLFYVASSHNADTRDALANIDKIVSAETTNDTIRTLGENTARLEKNVASLVGNIAPSEKLEKIFSSEIASSIQMIVNQIARVKEDLQKKPGQNK
jgi:hypothetical protein